MAKNRAQFDINNPTAAGSPGSGTVTSVTSANSAATVVNPTTTPVITVNIDDPAIMGEAFAAFPDAESIGPTDSVIILQDVLVLAAAGTSAVNGDYTYRGESNGYPYYNEDGGTSDPAGTDAISVFDTGGGLVAVVGGVGEQYESSQTIDNYADLFDALQDLVAVNGSNPVPTVTAVPTAMQGGASEETVVREITAATGTITDADNGSIIRANRGTAQTLTVTTPISAGFSCVVVQRGVGTVTLADDATVVLENRQSQFDTAGQFAVVSIIADADDFCVLAGDTA